jgi:hypothetical protein
LRTAKAAIALRKARQALGKHEKTHTSGIAPEGRRWEDDSMNIMGMWNEFNALDSGDKAIAVALCISGVLLMILWARFVTKRVRGALLIRLFHRVAVSSPSQIMKNPEDASGSYRKREEMDEPLPRRTIGCQLLRKPSDRIKSDTPCHCAANEGNNHTNSLRTDSNKENQCQLTFPHIIGQPLLESSLCFQRIPWGGVRSK